MSVVKLREIVGERRREDARYLRQRLFAQCRETINQMGDDLAGFALICWDTDGDPRSAINIGDGPVSKQLLPAYVHDALNRHVTVEMLTELQLTYMPEEP